MICLVLAAGYATRLYPLTENFPKPLLKVGEKTILNWLLDDIDQDPAVTSHVIISNHRYAGHFRQWAAQQHYRCPVTILDDGSCDNEHRLGAVADIAFAVDQLQLHDDLLIIAGDNVLDFSLREFMAFAAQKKASCVMCHEENDPQRQRRTAIITRENNGLVMSFEEKPANPKGNLAVPPFYFYTARDAARVHEAINSGCGTDAPGSFAAWLSHQTSMYAWMMPGKRYDIGNLESYQHACSIFGTAKDI